MIGYSYHAMKNCPEALKFYDKVLFLNEDFYAAWVCKGHVIFHQALEETENPQNIDQPIIDSVLECFNRGIRAAPDQTWAYIEKGSVLGALQRYAEAWDCLKKAIEIDPNDQETLFKAGLTLCQLGISENDALSLIHI